MSKRYFIYTSPTPVDSPPYGSPGWPPHCHAYHFTDGVHFLMLTQDEHFDEAELPAGWTRIPHYLYGQTLPAPVLALMQKDFPGIVATDTTLQAMLKVASRVHPHWAPVR